MLPLPMTPSQCLSGVIAPTFRELLPGKFDSPEARVMILAIFIQESGLAHRKQVGGPAHGLGQFEQRGGVAGVLAHPDTRLHAKAICLLRAVAPTESDVYAALALDDLLACAFARLLLWTDPEALPRLGDEVAARALYLRTWRPGAYQRDPDSVCERWHRSYALALAVVHP